jgi:hypothetical protein
LALFATALLTFAFGPGFLIRGRDGIDARAHHGTGGLDSPADDGTGRTDDRPYDTALEHQARADHDGKDPAGSDGPDHADVL